MIESIKNSFIEIFSAITTIAAILLTILALYTFICSIGLQLMNFMTIISSPTFFALGLSIIAAISFFKLSKKDIHGASSLVQGISTNILMTTSMITNIAYLGSYSMASSQPYILNSVRSFIFSRDPQNWAIPVAMACLSLFMPLQAKILIELLIRYSANAFIFSTIARSATEPSDAEKAFDLYRQICMSAIPGYKEGTRQDSWDQPIYGSRTYTFS